MADSDAKGVDLDALANARCEGPLWSDLLEDDSRGLKLPDFIAAESTRYLGSEAIAADRYFSPEFFAREKAKLWPKVWQFAAREEEMPEVGDTVVYENVGKSYLLVRQQDGSVRAFANVCLHRGRKLRLDSGPAKDFRCPFHAFTWNIDGSIKEIPCRWDFAHLTDEKMQLPEVRVARWMGFIFINEDPDAPDLLDFLDPLPRHFERWRLDECYTGLWVAKVVPANWKAVMEAFMEAWHSLETHPQILPFLGDANSRYDIYGDNVNRAVQPFGVISPHLYGTGVSEQDIIDSYKQFAGRSNPTLDALKAEPGQKARHVLAEAHRKIYLEDLGYDASEATDADVLENWTYNVFPNFSPWGGFMANIVYRWRPWPDQDHTLMEVRMLFRKPKDAPMPRAVPMHLLGPDEPWSAYKDWGSFGPILDQDMDNLPYVQDGLKASANNKVEFGNYQEMRIRQFQQTLDKYLAR